MIVNVIFFQNCKGNKTLIIHIVCFQSRDFVSEKKLLSAILVYHFSVEALLFLRKITMFEVVSSFCWLILQNGTLFDG